MTAQLLDTVGIPARPVRFPDPPAGTYAVYFDTVEADGPDGYNCLLTHDCTIELYAPRQDPEAESAVEAALTAQGLHWTKQDRYWLDGVKRYQTLFNYTWIEKRRL